MIPESSVVDPRSAACEESLHVSSTSGDSGESRELRVDCCRASAWAHLSVTLGWLLQAEHSVYSRNRGKFINIFAETKSCFSSFLLLHRSDMLCWWHHTVPAVHFGVCIRRNVNCNSTDTDEFLMLRQVHPCRTQAMPPYDGPKRWK